MNKETICTHYRLDFTNCNLEYDYTIVESLEDIKDYLIAVDTELDDPDADASVKITGIGMTNLQYNNFIKRGEP